MGTRARREIVPANSMNPKPPGLKRLLVGSVVKNPIAQIAVSKGIGAIARGQQARSTAKAISVPTARGTVVSQTDGSGLTKFSSKYSVLQLRGTGLAGAQYVVPICPWQASMQIRGNSTNVGTDPKLLLQYPQFTHWRAVSATVRYRGVAASTNPSKVYMGADKDPLCPPPENSEQDYSALAKSLRVPVWTEYTDKDCSLSCPVSGEWKSINDLATYQAYQNGNITPADAKLFFDGLIFIGFDSMPTAADTAMNFELDLNVEFKGRNPTAEPDFAVAGRTTGVAATALANVAEVSGGSISRMYWDGTRDHYPLNPGLYMATLTLSVVDAAIAGTGAAAIDIYDSTGAGVTATRRWFDALISYNGAAATGAINSPYGVGSTGGIQGAIFDFVIIFHAAAGDYVGYTDTLDAADTYKMLRFDIQRLSRQRAVKIVQSYDSTAVIPGSA